MTEYSIKVLIADDEPLARKRIRMMIRDHRDVEIVGECSNGIEAIASIGEAQPDLVFLDLEMPTVGGLDVVKRSIVRGPLFIFVTAHAQHGLAAFEAGAVDYLLKPFDQIRFDRALERARSRISAARSSMEPELSKILNELGKQAQYLRKISIRTSRSIIPLKVDDIDWIEADRNYVRLFVGDISYPKREAIGSIERQLDPVKFRRVNRSVIVNMDRVRELHVPTKGGEHEIVLINGKILTLSHGYRDNLAHLLA